jgi:polyhydroxybutyrate depolymerase
MGRGGWTATRVARWRARLGVPALALAVIPVGLAACGGSSASTATTATTAPVTVHTTTPAPPAASASPGCGSNVSPGTATITPTVDGRQRVAIVHVPTGYHPATPVPLVINMHGSQSTALQQVGLTGMDATADAHTFIVAYPQGDIPAGTGFEWNVPDEPLLGGAAVPATAPDDVSFVTQLVTLLEHNYCVDTERVYATGFSGGARMASQLACDASTVFAAVAPVSGLRLPSPCPSTRPVPVISFHGTGDPVDPYGGDGQKYWTYSVPAAATRWGDHNRCASPPRLRRFAPTVEITQYASCAAGAEVELFSIAGEGHEWPGGPHLAKSITTVLGPQTGAVSANDEMWSFFMAHPLPA